MRCMASGAASWSMWAPTASQPWSGNWTAWWRAWPVKQSIMSCASGARRTRWTSLSRTTPRCCITVSGPSRRGRYRSIYARKRTSSHAWTWSAPKRPTVGSVSACCSTFSSSIVALSYRRTIVQHVTANASDKLPSNQWWVIAYAIAPAIEKINKTFVMS